MEHPAEEDLLRFLLGMTSRQENLQIVRHLLARCPVCAAALRSPTPTPVEEPGAYDGALERFAARLRELAASSEERPTLLQRSRLAREQFLALRGLGYLALRSCERLLGRMFPFDRRGALLR